MLVPAPFPVQAQAQQQFVAHLPATANAPRRSYNKKSKKAPPLQALSVTDVPSILDPKSKVFSARVLQDYCRETAKEKGTQVPNSKMGRATVVADYLNSKATSSDI